jgi:hypothetical protein
MPVPCKANIHTGPSSTNDSTLLVVRYMGVDILGLFPRVVGEYRFLYVAINKFTKWSKATLGKHHPKDQLLPSSSRLSIDLVSRTVSSQITGPCSKDGSFKDIVKTSACSFALHLWHILEAMIKLRGKMRRSFGGSKHAHTIA